MLTDDLTKYQDIKDGYSAVKTYVYDVKSMEKANTTFEGLDTNNKEDTLKAIDVYSKALVPLTSLIATGVATSINMVRGDSYLKATRNNNDLYDEAKTKLSTPQEWLSRTIKWVGDKDFRDRLISDMAYAVDHGLEDSLAHMAKSMSEFNPKEYFGEFRMMSTLEEVESRGRRREAVSLDKGMYAFEKNGLKLSDTNEKILKRYLEEDMLELGFVKYEGYFNPDTLETGFYDDKSMNVVTEDAIRKESQDRVAAGYRYSFVGAEDGLLSKLPINKDINKMLKLGSDFQLYGMSDDDELRKKAGDIVTDSVGVLTTLGVAGGVALTASASAPAVVALGSAYVAYKGSQKIVTPIVKSVKNVADALSAPEAKERFKANFSHFVNYELKDVLVNVKDMLADESTSRFSGLKLKRSDEEIALRNEERALKAKHKDDKHLSRALYAKETRDVSFGSRDKKLFMKQLDESLSDFKRTEIFYNPETNEKMYYDTNTYKIYTAEDYKALFDENIPKLDAPSDKPKGMGLKRLIPRKFRKDEMSINPTDSRKDYGKTWSERHAEHKANLLKNTAIDMPVEENIAVDYDSVNLDYDDGDDLGF